MDLSSFITQTLVSIVKGIQDAQKQLPESCIVPEIELGDPREFTPSQVVEFDIAVSASEGSSIGARVGVLATFIGAEAKTATETTDNRVSRLKFSVPVRLPKAV